MKTYHLREVEPDEFHFPSDMPDVAELRIKLQRISRNHSPRPAIPAGSLQAILKNQGKYLEECRRLQSQPKTKIPRDGCLPVAVLLFSVLLALVVYSIAKFGCF